MVRQATQNSHRQAPSRTTVVRQKTSPIQKQRKERRDPIRFTKRTRAGTLKKIAIVSKRPFLKERAKNPIQLRPENLHHPKEITDEGDGGAGRLLMARSIKALNFQSSEKARSEEPN